MVHFVFSSYSPHSFRSVNIVFTWSMFSSNSYSPHTAHFLLTPSIFTTYNPLSSHSASFVLIPSPSDAHFVLIYSDPSPLVVFTLFFHVFWSLSSLVVFTLSSYVLIISPLVVITFSLYILISLTACPWFILIPRLFVFTLSIIHSDPSALVVFTLSIIHFDPSALVVFTLSIIH
jgi:hypothetical protein